MKKIPAYIITGFLGSGKTTLINNILKYKELDNIAVIENEFGEINIDENLIINNIEKVYSLKNGCICCSLNNEFSETLLSILEYNSKIKLLLIETTGIADPNSIASSFYEPIINDLIDLIGTICIVDSDNFLVRFKSEMVIAKQIAFADYIILNKIDLVDTNQAVIIKKIIQRINPDAELIESHYSMIDLSFIVNSNKYKTKIPSLKHWANHQVEYQSISFEIDRKFVENYFNYAITTINNIYKDNILRIKGIVYFENAENPFIFQSIKDFGNLIELNNYDNSDAKSKIVIIGKNLNRAVILKELSAALTEEDEF